MATDKNTVKKEEDWKDYSPARGEQGWQDYDPKAANELVAAGAPDVIQQAQQRVARIIPEEEAYRQDPRLRNIKLPEDVTPAEVIEREKGYNEAGQLGTALSTVSGLGALRSVIANPRMLVPIGRTLLGGAAGATAGGYGGRELGRIVGAPELGGQVGATLGGLAGGFASARGGRVPFTRGWLGELGTEEAAGLPAERRPVPIRQSPNFNPEAYRAGQRARLQGIAPTAIEPIVQPATGPVTRLPVPREPLPGENEGYMASVPRSRLLELGRQGRPGAGTQLQNIGRKVLYVPEEYPAHEKVGLPTIEPEGESRIEQIRRRAPGESPTVKSLRRHFEKSAAD